jgi:hypothetical protein
MQSNAELAELADAHVSGACDRKVIRVQVPGSAQYGALPKRNATPEHLAPGFDFASGQFARFHIPCYNRANKTPKQIASGFQCYAEPGT